ncbi:nuclear serine protease HtrA2/Nma111 [Periconia macrospinosa]|uniref:Pro-apoptotic serine protease NMA111 n=1 Tax=Periconia macrospinosa TaxID=97972 RepID=A0A2V1CZW0_9PLEO|nr:nuclear serine protease HtrA2/Nma111 [Periconia macrospinosa]
MAVPHDSMPMEWQDVTKCTVQSVVSIHFCHTRSFETNPAVSAEATGFVVDAEKGYILTNRHVVGAGPFTGYCIFNNREECNVYPVYRDPVHDFGFLRFDPKAIKYMLVIALQLRPDCAKVGAEICVVGNDACEKLSILSGVIGRLDRKAPRYDKGYFDFNTNYIQAAAGTSGGSSGSPVVNKNGFAVALQAGGRTNAATNFCLPLDRPLRALKLIQQGKHVSRGTIQTRWVLEAIDECRRLGLSPYWEEAVRAQFPTENGMLVAKTILPDGPASRILQEGDILLKVNNNIVTKLVDLDSILDDSVGKKVFMTIERAGQAIEVELEVVNTHSITPNQIVSVAGASFHNLSYQQAMRQAISLKNQGVYICEVGGSFHFANAYNPGVLVLKVDNKCTPSLETFVEVMKEIPDKKRVVIDYKHLFDMHKPCMKIITIDRHWYPEMRIGERNDVTGVWDFRTMSNAVTVASPIPGRTNVIKLRSKHPKIVEIVPNLVRVDVSMPVKLDGFPVMHEKGCGLVVDAEQGLVLVSRAFLPNDLGDISLTIGNSILAEAKVVFMHPLQNYAIVQYDTSLVNAAVKTPNFAATSIQKGDETTFVGLNSNFQPVVFETVVTDVLTRDIPHNQKPRYRATIFDAITIDTTQAVYCPCGVLVARDGTVQALWLSYLGERDSDDKVYRFGLATPRILPVLTEIRSGKTPELRMLNVGFRAVQMSEARVMGVSEEWIDQVEENDSELRQLLMVQKVDSDHRDLNEGDILLTLNDELMTSASRLDVMYNNLYLDAVIFRERKEARFTVPTIPTRALETDRLVKFCGAILQQPHQAVRQQISRTPSNVYISSRAKGSPFKQYGIEPTNFITHVNDAPTPNLDTFLEEVQKISDNTYFRLNVTTFDNVRLVQTLKKNEHYFPTIEYVKAELGWRAIEHKTEVGGPMQGVE